MCVFKYCKPLDTLKLYKDTYYERILYFCVIIHQQYKKKIFQRISYIFALSYSCVCRHEQDT